MSESQALQPIDSRSVDFYGDEIVGVLVELAGEQRIYVPLRPICRYLGLDWSAQYRRTQRDEVLADELRFVAMTPTNPQGGDPETLRCRSTSCPAGSSASMLSPPVGRL